jgi:putative molybdopterin biosynthesis protein
MPAPDAALVPSSRPLLERIAFSPDEVAQLLGLSRATIYNLMNRGELRYTSIGNRRRIHRFEVDRLAGRPEDGAA